MINLTYFYFIMKQMRTVYSYTVFDPQTNKVKLTSSPLLINIIKIIIPYHLIKFKYKLVH